MRLLPNPNVLVAVQLGHADSKAVPTNCRILQQLRYLGLMIHFTSYTAAETSNIFNGPDKPQ